MPRYEARVCFDLDRLLRITNSTTGAERTVSIRPVERSVHVLQVSSAPRCRQSTTNAPAYLLMRREFGARRVSAKERSPIRD